MAAMMVVPGRAERRFSSRARACVVVVEALGRLVGNGRDGRARAHLLIGRVTKN